MSRSYSSYDADWQRRKSVLIRSLFHDIPILSPVEEESNDSSQDYYVPTQEPFPSPQRPYSPLPSLIIEKVPITNKHDEPEDYYNKLYNKIKRIYKDLFIEKRNFSSIDYDSNCSDSSVNNDSVSSVENLDYHFLENNDKSPDNDSIIEDRDTRRTSATTKSDGYGADFESMETAIIDVVNKTPSNEDGLMISEAEESVRESIDGDGIRNNDSESTRSDEESDSSRSTDNKESRRETIDYPEFGREEKPRHSITDDHEITEEEESIEPEDEQSFEKEGSDNENIDEHDVIEETSQVEDSETERIGDPMFSGGEVSHNSSKYDDHEKSESEECNYIEKEPQSNNIPQRKLHSFEKESMKIKSKELEKTASEDTNDLMESSVEPMEEDEETSDSGEGPVYRQITTAAMVHIDGSQDAEERESQIYEDSAKSVILPTRFRRVAFRRNVDADDRIEVLPILEENADSTTTPSFYTDETTEEDFEEATLQLQAKEEGIIETTTPQADAQDEYDEEISTSEEDGEEISTPQQDSAEQNVEGMGSPQLNVRQEETEKTGPILPKRTEHNAKKISTPQPNPAEEDVEGMGIPQPASRKKETKVTETDVKEMGPLRFDTPEEDDEDMTSPQPESAEEDVEGIGSAQSDARDEESKANEVDVEELGSPHSIEQMRTPRPDLSHGTIPTTRQSISESASEHTAASQEHSALTSSTQDGADHMPEIQTSNDINDILTSIFNESRNKDRTPISGKKRKLVDKSVQAVQTSRVTWEEMRANFFVGTPKIFRLCACTDHICY